MAMEQKSTPIILKGRVIDGNGGEPIEKGLVAVEGSKITAVCQERAYTVPARAEVIEVKDGTIMPGMVEMHTHLALTCNFYEVYTTHPYHAVCIALRDMERILNCGFTSMRECGGLSNFIKPMQENGTIDGPRIFSAGKCVVQTGGHFDFIKEYPVEYAVHHDRNVISTVVDGIDAARKTARLQFREGADFIKLMVTPGVVSQSGKFMTQELSDEEIRVFVEEAEKYGTYVAAHTHANAGIKAALRCGVQCVEHGTFLGEEDVEVMLQRGTWLIPTLATGYRFMQNLDKVKPWVREKEKIASEAGLHSARMAYQAGIPMAVGADFGGDEICPHGLNGLELQLLVERVGMSPMEALVAATKTGANMILRGRELGTLEEGKLADIIVVSGNPLDDIRLMVGPEHIAVVLQNGQVKKRPQDVRNI